MRRRKPRIFIEKGTGDITIVFNKSYSSDECNVTLVHDRGVGDLRNMFGGKVARYRWHCANAGGDSGYSTCTDDIWYKRDKADYVEYKMIRKK